MTYDHWKTTEMETDSKPKEQRKRRVMCEDCGKYPADPPSRLCPGCEAYREHQQ